MVNATLMVVKTVVLGDRFSQSTSVFPANSHSTSCFTCIYDPIFQYCDSLIYILTASFTDEFERNIFSS
jgi:hypothetical protein